MGTLKDRYIKKQRDLSQAVCAPIFPKIIKIDICNNCNYSCVFCPQAKQGKKIGNIDDALCRQIISDGYYAGAREICLSSTGEPLLNSMLPEYIRYCKDIGYTYIFFNTNGYLMSEDKAYKIISGGVDSVKFSINASKKSYRLVHGVEGYARVINNLKSFDRIRKELSSSCKLYVSYVATKYTQEEAATVEEEVAGYCDEFMKMNANNRGGVADEVDGELYTDIDEYSYQFPCSQIFNNVYVTSEGFMVACCQDFENNLVIADLHDISVKDAWNCDMFVEFRNKFLKREYKGLLCENCLHGTHNPVTPLNPVYAGYEHFTEREKSLRKRIKELSFL